MAGSGHDAQYGTELMYSESKGVPVKKYECNLQLYAEIIPEVRMQLISLPDIMRFSSPDSHRKLGALTMYRRPKRPKHPAPSFSSCAKKKCRASTGPG